MAYTRTTWENYPGNTPVNATRLNNIEQGLVDTDTALTYADLQTITDTSYTLALANAAPNRHLRFTSNSDVTVTVPANGTIAFPVGSVVRLLYAGSASLSVGGAAGVTILGQMVAGYGTFGGGSFGPYKIVQSDVITLVKTETDVWAFFQQSGPRQFAVLA